MVKSLKKHYNMYKLGHSLRALRSTAVLEEEKKNTIFPYFLFLVFGTWT